MTGISSDCVKKRAERREREVLMMVNKYIVEVIFIRISQVLTMVAVFLVCWGPYAVLSIFGLLGLHKVSLLSNSYMQLGFHKVIQTVQCN